MVCFVHCSQSDGEVLMNALMLGALIMYLKVTRLSHSDVIVVYVVIVTQI